MTKGYRKGVRIVRFPGGRVARFHKPGTAAYARGVAKKKRMGKLLAQRFGIKKKRRSNPGKYARRSRVYDPFTGRMVKTKPHRALMGGTVKRSKGPRGVRGVKGPDGVWRRPNPGKGYNGYPSWNAWNVSLWINNDEGLYSFARELKRKLGTARAAEAFVDECGMAHTPDGAPFTVSSVKGAMRGM